MAHNKVFICVSFFCTEITKCVFIFFSFKYTLCINQKNKREKEAVSWEMILKQILMKLLHF